MKKNLMMLLFLFLTNAAQKFTMNKEAYQEISELRIKIAYLKIVKSCRLLFISSLGVGVCLILLLSSLVLFHITFFLYAPFSAEAKMWIGFACAAVYLIIAVKMFTYVFAEKKWLEIFNAENLLPQQDGILEAKPSQ